MRGVACGIIADMWRVMVGLAAWIAGTGIAVSVAWLGANVVITNAGVGPGIPLISVAVPPPSAASAPAPPPPATVAATPTGRATTPKNAAASAAAHSPAAATLSPDKAGPSPSASAPASAAAGDVHAYTLAGGNVTLDMTGGSVQLVTAVPNAGYSVQTWSGTGWLRVDFSSGPQVSSLIASWYQHAPTVTITN
jgi:hypothetical protein